MLKKNVSYQIQFVLVSRRLLLLLLLCCWCRVQLLDVVMNSLMLVVETVVMKLCRKSTFHYHHRLV